ncbi:hypothetical protein C8Q80DRAFT_332018 [Daedaleopsis nitida]|nr:hypothetical protein C8Q80DRAFT_332018 [Daedaleopsis nitida]
MQPQVLAGKTSAERARGLEPSWTPARPHLAACALDSPTCPDRAINSPPYLALQSARPYRHVVHISLSLSTGGDHAVTCRLHRQYRLAAVIRKQPPTRNNCTPATSEPRGVPTPDGLRAGACSDSPCTPSESTLRAAAPCVAPISHLPSPVSRLPSPISRLPLSAPHGPSQPAQSTVLHLTTKYCNSFFRDNPARQQQP